jgi:excisionase family DNA binding protein
MRRDGSQLSLQLLQADNGGRQRTKRTPWNPPSLPRLSISPGEAAEMLGVSRDFFDEHIKPELRIVRRGSKTILIPIAELERWLDKSAARYPI